MQLVVFLFLDFCLTISVFFVTTARRKDFCKTAHVNRVCKQEEFDRIIPVNPPIVNTNTNRGFSVTSRPCFQRCRVRFPVGDPSVRTTFPLIKGLYSHFWFNHRLNILYRIVDLIYGLTYPFQNSIAVDRTNYYKYKVFTYLQVFLNTNFYYHFKFSLPGCSRSFYPFLSLTSFSLPKQNNPVKLPKTLSAC